MLSIPIVVSVLSIVFAYFLVREINKAVSGSGKMIEISQAIKEGALAFFKRQYRACGLAAVVIFFLFLIFLGIKIAIGFLIGAIVSGLIGFNVKNDTATGFLVVGLALLTVSGLYFLMSDFQALIALCLGAGLLAIFVMLEEHAGTAADLFQTYVIVLVAAMILGSLLFQTEAAIFLPLVLTSIVILASVLSTFLVRLGKNQNIIGILYKGLLVAGLLSVLGFLPVIFQFSQDLKISPFSLYLPALIGLLIAGGMLMGKKSTILPVMLILFAVLICVPLGGIYALAISVVAMLSLIGLIPALNSKDCAIASAGLAALVLFSVYTQELRDLGRIVKFNFEEPGVLVGLFAGGIIVYYFAALTTNKNKVLPGLLPVLAPVLAGFLLGPEVLAGLLVGSIIVGIFLALHNVNAISPAISPFIKLLNVVALLIVVFLAR